MTASRIGLRALGLMASVAVCAASAGTGCGDSRADEVYVRFFHGYPGSPSISVFSSQGNLVRDLQFNEYSDVVAIDRGLFDGQFQLLAEGVPVTGILPGQDVFGMYNGETATIMITSRSQAQQFSSLFLRHHLITPGTGALFGLDNYNCALEIHNGLAVSNGAGDRFTFSLQREATQDEIDTTYNGALDEQIATECGLLNLRDAKFPPGTGIANRRAEIRDEINGDPWLWPVEIESETTQEGRQDRYTFVAGVWLNSGSLSSVRPTVEYRECLATAITIAQDDMAGGMMQESPCDFGPAGPQIPEENGVYKLEVDLDEVNRCVNGLDEYTLTTFLPTEGNTSVAQVLYYYTSAQRPACEGRYRIRTAGVDSIFMPENDANSPGSGRKVTLRYSSPASTYQYMVIYGLPLNPLVEFINGTDAAQGFFEDTRYPPDGRLYPNEESNSN